MHWTLSVRDLAWVLLALLVSASPVAASSPEKAAPAFDAGACGVALRRHREDRSARGGRLEDLVRPCVNLFSAQECRVAWERALTMPSHESRLDAILKGCTRAYCASLSPRPQLCDPTPRWLNILEVAEQWPEFQQAVLTHDHGAGAGALSSSLTLLLMDWTDTRSRYLTAPRVLRMMKVSDHVELEFRDARGQVLRAWAFQDEPSPAQLRELREQLKQLPKASRDVPVPLRVDADPEVGFRQVKQVLQAFTESGDKNLTFSLLKRLPASKP